MRARAYIAIPLPEPATWKLLRDPAELADGFTIVGSLEVGQADAPALTVQTITNWPALTGEADGVTLSEWRALFALFARMDAQQRSRLIGYAGELLEKRGTP
jgi:hypothetical protein